MSLASSPAMRRCACSRAGTRVCAALGAPVPDLRLSLPGARVRGRGGPYGSSSAAGSRGRSGRQDAAYATYASRSSLKILLHKVEFQRGRHLSERGADLLKGDTEYVLNHL